VGGVPGKKEDQHRRRPEYSISARNAGAPSKKIKMSVNAEHNRIGKLSLP
jgi:hypothetical protein